MEIALRFLRYSEKIAHAYSAIAQNSTLWKSTLRSVVGSVRQASRSSFNLVVQFNKRNNNTDQN